MSSVVISGDTSGTVSLQAPAVAGSTVLTLPATSGTVITTTSGTASSATTATTATNLSGGSNGTIPYQSASGTTQMLAVGTSGQVLQTNGAGAPSWVTPSTGAMTLISTSTVTNAASVAFTGLTSAYSSYLLVILNAYNTGSGGYPLYMQVSTDNSTYISTATYMYALLYNYARSSGSAVSQINNFSNAGGYDTKIYLSSYGSGGSSSVTPLAGEIKLFNPSNGTQATVIQSRISACDSTPTFAQETGFSANTTTSAIQAFKLYFSTGNIWGTFKLYGIT
jgi:hypothetical protein